MKMKVFMTVLLAATMANVAIAQEKPREIWSKKKAAKWYKQHDWQRGSNFIPSYAINQLEMWQPETFDTAAINRELKYAASIGLNSMRVFLHHAAWQQDPEGFKQRVSTYLDVASRNGISTTFVLFDDCWNKTYTTGKQPEPKTGIHNSGWLQDPGIIRESSPALTDTLERYVKDVLTTFRKDKRILLWDLYNEPGNSGYGNKSMDLLTKTFSWARQVKTIQPVSSGVWNKDLKDLNVYQLNNSDVITYHNYADEKEHQETIDSLRKYERPLICTEYMARTRGSKFQNIMPLLKKEKVAAYNWGLVSGKTNTIYAWDTPMKDGGEPPVWFHDIFRKDGTPYSAEEVTVIKSLTGAQ
ncbi:glycoside hydrolase family 2 TIM barrel-domain containing protein [Chitinophaga sp. S165]|uniref:glycoside hydrolase family 2 TIM barrel-domain containing protein n=1 Tax=Chitinophaga sp. S165 TaxID=2135462 RepID=UPI000D963C1C|nr:glycoside hydrolase family 2 TIM barrel-domain containing protein [Chitinophaga sp. S165]PWV45221.1 glycosyl hydrolase family 2 [Chitinophaga sp. S165]